jgi:ABC-type lipoprotein export system ATPase subunit
MVTHSPEHGAWADRVCFLKNGVITAELEQNGNMEDATPIHRKLLELGI